MHNIYLQKNKNVKKNVHNKRVKRLFFIFLKKYSIHKTYINKQILKTLTLRILVVAAKEQRQAKSATSELEMLPFPSVVIPEAILQKYRAW